ncbi:hypothetical protein HELRODRAFT_191743 [Helobdella robusta]|uniref:CKK domain-containing protein n=1 Tax=Helobdella robusta TaxID=6412 RepID=T1FT91_HELRO|nr:hypothetical protein HELRODRAFT_191743 [Helobdella robusta]ESO04191.1 hypothetical protein HELRODRAFT_191743 [Helobdella robusta]
MFFIVFITVFVIALGPRLFVKPSSKSNKNIVENALSHCCLAGLVNQDVKCKALEALQKSSSKHFVVLFRDVGMQYRGLYAYNINHNIPCSDIGTRGCEIVRLHGVGPKVVEPKQIEKFFKYNSGAKNFFEVTSTKHLSATIDGVTLYGAVWQKGRHLAVGSAAAAAANGIANAGTGSGTTAVDLGNGGGEFGRSKKNLTG